MNPYYEPYWLNNDELEHYGVKGMKWGVIRGLGKTSAKTIKRSLTNPETLHGDAINEMTKYKQRQQTYKPQTSSQKKNFNNMYSVDSKKPEVGTLRTGDAKHGYKTEIKAYAYGSDGKPQGTPPIGMWTSGGSSISGYTYQTSIMNNYTGAVEVITVTGESLVDEQTLQNAANERKAQIVAQNGTAAVQKIVTDPSFMKKLTSKANKNVSRTMNSTPESKKSDNAIKKIINKMKIKLSSIFKKK